MKDHFIAEMLPFVTQLNGMQTVERADAGSRSDAAAEEKRVDFIRATTRPEGRGREITTVLSSGADTQPTFDSRDFTVPGFA